MTLRKSATLFTSRVLIEQSQTREKALYMPLPSLWEDVETLEIPQGLRVRASLLRKGPVGYWERGVRALAVA